MKWAILIASTLLLLSIPMAAKGDAAHGRQLYEAQDYAGARAQFEALLDEDEDNAEALYYLGRISRDHWDLDRAKKYFEKLVEVAPNNAEYQYRLADTYGQIARTSGWFMTKKKFAGKWLEGLERAVQLDPAHLEARQQLSGYLLNAPGIGGGDKDRGTEVARETIAIDEPLGRLMLAYAYRKIEQPDKAIEECTTVIALTPGNALAYRGRGFAYYDKGDDAAARAEFERAIEADPKSYEALEAMAWFCRERGLSDEMIAYTKRAVEVDPLQSDRRYDLAKAYDERKDTTNAILHYEMLVTLTPEHHKAGDARKRLKKLKNPKRYGR